MKNTISLLSTRIALIFATVVTAQFTFAAPGSQSELNELQSRQIADEVARTDRHIEEKRIQRQAYRREGLAIEDRGLTIAKSGTASEIAEFRRAHGGDYRLSGHSVWNALVDRERALQSPIKKGVRKIPVVGAVATGLGAYGALANVSETQAATVDDTSSESSALRAEGSVNLNSPIVTPVKEEPATFRRTRSQTAR